MKFIQAVKTRCNFDLLFGLKREACAKLLVAKKEELEAAAASVQLWGTDCDKVEPRKKKFELIYNKKEFSNLNILKSCGFPITFTMVFFHFHLRLVF